MEDGLYVAFQFRSFLHVIFAALVVVVVVVKESKLTQAIQSLVIDSDDD